jgi:hypothetical protein
VSAPEPDRRDRRARPKSSSGVLAAVLATVLGIGGIALVQPGLASTAYKVRQRDDVFLLPPPRELRVMTLGYRAAATDLLWAKLILEYGLHAREKRAFPDAYRYVDGIIALEPEFPTVYRFLDTILVFNPIGGTADDARMARRYFEMGTRNRPYDPEMWSLYGQFIAFLSPTFLTDETEIQQWRADGARALTRAVELGGDPSRSLSATTMLSKAGEQKAAIQHLQRAYAMTEDPNIREQILLHLRKLEASSEAEESISVIEREWRSRYGFLSRGTALLIGPRRSAAACAGRDAYGRRGCPNDWTAAIEDSK